MPVSTSAPTDPSGAPAKRNRQGSYLAAGATVAERNAEMSKRANARHSLDSYISSVVRRAPELTPAQIQRLRDILPPVDHTATAPAIDEAA